MKLLPHAKRIFLAAAIAAVLAPFGRKQAEATVIASTTLAIGASVNIKCTIISVPLNFGTYYPGGVNATAPLDGQGGISLDCDGKGAMTDVRLGQGLNPAPGSTDKNPLRRLRYNTSYLTYNLYEDAAHTTVWDNWPKGPKGGRTFPIIIPVYGRIPAGQGVPSGAYTDTVIATVYF